jgi:cytochrome o ubiquinol oxidase subunit 1
VRLGKLSWETIPLNEPLALISRAVVAIVMVVALGIITIRGWRPYLWRLLLVALRG